MTVNQQWNNAWIQAMMQRSNVLSQRQTQTLLQQGKLAQAQRMRQHQDYMAGVQQQGENRRAQFQNQQFRKTQNKEDYVDFILDCQRAYSGNNRVSVGNCPNRETF